MTSTSILAPLDPRIPRWDVTALLGRPCPLCAGEGTPRFQRPDALVVRSCTCGLWFVSPAPSPAALDAFYATYSTAHRVGGAQRHVAAVRARRPEESLVLTELSSLAPLRGKRVLDVGCGSGVFLDLAQRLGAESHGVDLDPASVSFATEHLGLSHVRTGTIFEIDGPMFDIITMLDFIEHPLDVTPTLARAHALLAPGGLLALWTPDASAFDVDEEPVALRMDLEHMQYFSCRSIGEIARRFDFTLVHLETLGHASGVPAVPSPGSSLGREALESGKRLARAALRRIGASGIRARGWARVDPWAERRGRYHLLAILAKR